MSNHFPVPQTTQLVLDTCTSLNSKKLPFLPKDSRRSSHGSKYFSCKHEGLSLEQAQFEFIQRRESQEAQRVKKPPTSKMLERKEGRRVEQHSTMDRSNSILVTEREGQNRTMEEWERMGKKPTNLGQATYLQKRPSKCSDSPFTLQHSLEVADDHFQKGCVTQRSHLSKPGELPLQVLAVPNSIGKENHHRDAQKIKLNTRQFVRKMIQGEVKELTRRDEVFGNLRRFVMESDCFLANNEKHYRIKFIMDLVEALIQSIHSYSQRSVSTSELEILSQKVAKYKALNQDLSLKYSELRMEMEKEKAELIAGYASQLQQSLQEINLEQERLSMQNEDTKARLLQDQSYISDERRRLQEQYQTLKLGQSNLQEDIKNFISVKGAFEQQRNLELKQLQEMKEETENQLKQLEKHFKDKNDHLKKYDQELREREKALTNLILNNYSTPKNEKEINFVPSASPSPILVGFIGPNNQKSSSKKYHEKY